ncbi:RNA-directed DNA polymerase [Kitasatospora sp. NPDC059088]|uniref:RNA-directed DNA polymerase n=1 Tax=Kitasatospora sp. NPDC059088 TaxID=3346722 RepID=UPI0036AC270A
MADMVISGRLTLPHETFAMPKKRFGPRPVTMGATAARVAYLALVNHMGESLGPKSRDGDSWEIHKSFALSGEGEYVVKFDIASFYEYVDHEILRRQVLAQTLAPEGVQSLSNILASVVGGARGLPQLSSASDHLADVYIGVLERQLKRDGYLLSRYADDFTIRCADWETANTAIERSAEYARTLGLVLSSEKTTINKHSTLTAADRAEKEFFNRYFEAARIELTQLFSWGDYGDVEVVEGASDEESTPDQESTIRAALWKLVNDWSAEQKRDDPEDLFQIEGHFRAYLGGALYWLRNYDESIPDKTLQDIVFRHPILLSSVCGYIAEHRPMWVFFANDEWESISLLCAMGRQSPWAKLWLLNSIASIQNVDSEKYEPVMAWVEEQLNDRHEIVRAEAAWAAACHGRLTEVPLLRLYMAASPISQAGISAAMGRQGTVGKSTVNSIIGDGPTIKKAHEWGAEKSTSQA